MKQLTLQELSVEHDYYASSTNYYNNDVSAHFNSWGDFLEEYGDADINQNLIFRWDILKKDNDGYGMQIIMIGQRRGIYIPIQISWIYESDVPTIIAFMKPHFNKLLSLWRPLSEAYRY